MSADFSSDSENGNPASEDEKRKKALTAPSSTEYYLNKRQTISLGDCDGSEDNSLKLRRDANVNQLEDAWFSLQQTDATTSKILKWR